MEDEIGHKLFVRLPSGIGLTPTGEIFRDCFRKIIHELENAKTACSSLKEKIFGNIHIAVHPIIGRTAIPLIEEEMGSVNALNLHYKFEHSRDAIQSVTNFDVDFAIVASTFQHADIKKIKLWTENIELYSKSGKMEKTIIANQNMINAEKILKKLKPEKVRWVNDYGVLLSILESNDVMGLLPNTILSKKTSLKSLQRFNPSFEISLIYRTDLEKTASHQWVINTLKKKCQTL